jgi:hypothetical protein
VVQLSSLGISAHCADTVARTRHAEFFMQSGGEQGTVPIDEAGRCRSGVWWRRKNRPAASWRRSLVAYLEMRAEPVAAISVAAGIQLAGGLSVGATWKASEGLHQTARSFSSSRNLIVHSSSIHQRWS